MMKILTVVSVALVFLFTSVYGQGTKKTLGGSSTKSTQENKVETQKKTMPVLPPKSTEIKKESKENKTSSKAKSAKPIKGRIASLSGIFMGGDGRVSKEEAITMAGKGDPIVFVVGEGKRAKIYFVFNTDGTFGGKNLAKYASNKYVGIIGKKTSKNGLNFIIAESIESMD